MAIMTVHCMTTTPDSQKSLLHCAVSCLSDNCVLYILEAATKQEFVFPCIKIVNM